MKKYKFYVANKQITVLANSIQEALRKIKISMPNVYKNFKVVEEIGLKKGKKKWHGKG